MDGATLEVQFLSRETIKPSSPTPYHMRSLELSLLDQITVHVYVSSIFLYKINGNVKAEEISRRLKSSLSETLTKFYPFSGRIRNDVLVDCNDEGVEFVEARANGTLSEFLQKPDRELLRNFHSIDMENVAAKTGKILSVQVTFFDCGELAIEVIVSHKLLDAKSVATFIKSWAMATRCAESSKAILPEYVTASLFPPTESFVPYPVRNSRCEQTRFVFGASEIDQLKAKVASASVPNPSRVEALIGLLWKCARDVSRSTRGRGRPSLLINAMDLRKLVEPPLPDTSVGNNVVYLSAITSEEDTELQDLVCLLRNAKQECTKNGIRNLLETKSIICVPDDSIRDKLERDEIDFFKFSSLLRLPFYEGADFGWGEPLHVTFPNYVADNLFILMDTKDGGGVEALLTLNPEDAALFECNQELLEFATLNPPIN